MRPVARPVLAIAIAAAGAGTATPAARQTCTQPTIQRLGGTTQFTDSTSPALSADGRFAAFISRASLGAPDQVMVYDRVTCALEIASVASDESPGANSSEKPSLSADGRFVAFESRAINLAPPDANQFEPDVFVRDRLLGTTQIASLDSDETQSAPGRSTAPVISADGRFVAFISTATTFVPGDTNAEADIFVRDLVSGTTERVSVAADGSQGDTASNNGANSPAISADGRYVAFRTGMILTPGGVGGIYVRDRLLNTTVLASVNAAGVGLTFLSTNFALSADGRSVFFASTENNVVPGNPTCDGIYVRDLETSTTWCPALKPNGVPSSGASSPSVSADGRYVGFLSSAPHYVPGDTDGHVNAFLLDQVTGSIKMVSATVYGQPVEPANGVPIVISGDGQLVAFVSGSMLLVPGTVGGAFLVRWSELSSLPDANVLRNSSFGSGLQFWQVFSTPDPSYIVTDAASGVLQFYRVPPPVGTSNQAVVFQHTWAQLLPHAPIEARFRLGNSSTSRKRMSVLLHDGDFSDLSVCVFWLPPGAPDRDYIMRTHTTKRWSNATISFYAATAGSDGGFYRVDDVSVMYRPYQDDDVTACVDPTAPVAPGGADGTTLLGNGDFSSGLAPWTTFGQINWQITNGVFEFSRPLGTPAGVVLQPTGQALAANSIVTATLYLGNASAVRQRVTVLLHDNNFTDLSACTFWLPPGQLLAPYRMRTFAAQAWADATMSVYPATVGGGSWLRLDNASLRLTPGSPPQGTECIEPGADVPLTVEPDRASVEASRPGPAWQPMARDLGDVTNLRLAFYSLSTTSRSEAELQVSLDGVSWTTVATVPFSEDWQEVEIDLRAYAGAVLLVRLALDGDTLWPTGGGARYFRFGG